MRNLSPFDALDARIVLAIDEDPSATALSLSRVLGVARNTVHARLRRLDSGGALGNYSRRVDPGALGFGLTAFAEISISQGSAAEAYAGLRSIPEIVEVHSTTGDADLLAKVVAKDTADLQRLTTAILTTPGVQRMSTSVSLQEVLPYRVSALLEQVATTPR